MKRRRKLWSIRRWKGKKVKPGDPNYDQARWWMEYRLNGRRVHQAIPEARTKAQAERAEVSEREAIYNRRYNRGTDIGFKDYYDEFYLPWLKEKKASQVLDGESRVKKLKEHFGNRLLSDITRRDVERFQLTLRGKKTPRKVPRKGATINRYVYLCQQFFREQYAMKLLTSIPAIGSNRNQRPGGNAISCRLSNRS